MLMKKNKKETEKRQNVCTIFSIKCENNAKAEQNIAFLIAKSIFWNYNFDKIEINFKY